MADSAGDPDIDPALFARLAVGTAHGGVTMALLDVVHTAVSNSHGTVAVAQDVHTEFLARAGEGGRLTAEGTEVHRIEARTGRPWEPA